MPRLETKVPCMFCGDLTDNPSRACENDACDDAWFEAFKRGDFAIGLAEEASQKDSNDQE